MDINSLTPQQLRDLADKKEVENRVVKSGYLKTDLYNFDSNSIDGLFFTKSWGDFWLKSNDEKLRLIQEFDSRFKKVLDKGTKFICFNRDGKEHWSDNINYGLDGLSGEWAEKYLENIVEI